MIRQKTSNTFGDGLMLDANPLTATQKSLSNCLNGTFITMDGDEGILLNDMGNYRVDKIKLDTGYIPVGMCTYGGITYIASYNPVTNMGLVGSFPSPATEGWSKDTYDAATGNPLTATNVNYILLLSTDIFRTGDKFDLYLDDAINEKLVSHIYNTVFLDLNNTVLDLSTALKPDKDQIVTTKIKSPKNKALTVSLCVLDSSGNLHDISSKVNKFLINESDGTYTLFPYSNDEEILLNQGTFFKIKYLTSDGKSQSEVDDNYIDGEPDLVFNSKISSNLYLVYTVNSLTDYTISAEFFKPTDSALDMINVDRTDFEGADESTRTVSDDLVGILLQVDYYYNSPDNYFDIWDHDEGTGVLNTSLLHSTNSKYLSDYGFSDDFDPTKVLNGLVLTSKTVDNKSTDSSDTEGSGGNSGGSGNDDGPDNIIDDGSGDDGSGNDGSGSGNTGSGNGDEDVPGSTDDSGSDDTKGNSGSDTGGSGDITDGSLIDVVNNNTGEASDNEEDDSNPIDKENESIKYYLPFDPNQAESKPVFDYTEYLYKTIHKYWYLHNEKSGVTTFTFTPSTIYGDLTNLIKLLKVDLDKIGSGIIQAADWKYYVDGDSNIALNFSIESYPYTGTRLTNVRLEFYNLTDTASNACSEPDLIITLETRSSYHGSFYNYIDSADTSLGIGNLYLVIFKYDLCDTSGEILSEGNLMSYRTFLYTQLYNDMYDNLDISNYNDLSNAEPNTTAESGMYEYYHTYTPQINLDITEDVSGGSPYNSSTLLANLEAQKRFIYLGSDYDVNTTVEISEIPAASLSNYPFSINIDSTNSKIDTVYVSADSADLSWTLYNMASTTITNSDVEGTIYELSTTFESAALTYLTNTVTCSSITSMSNTHTKSDGVYSVTGNKTNLNFTFNYGPAYYLRAVTSGSKELIITKPYVSYYELYGENMYEPYTWITPGMSWDKRGGHRDEHVARYLDFVRVVDEDKTTNNVYYHVTDITSDYFPTESELLGCTTVRMNRDGLVTFTLKEFLELGESDSYFHDDQMYLIHYYTDETLQLKPVTLATVTAWSNSTHTEEENNTTYGHTDLPNDIGIVLTESYDAKTIDHWNDDDYYTTMKQSTMLLWKINGGWYSIKYPSTTTLKPDTLSGTLEKFFSQFVIPSDSVISYNLSFVPDISAYMYTSAFGAEINYGIKGTVKYSSTINGEDYAPVIRRNLGTLGVKLGEEISGVEGEAQDSIVKYTEFILSTTVDDTDITSTTHNVTSAENIHDFIVALNEGTFDNPAYVYTVTEGNKTSTYLLLHDVNGNSLLENLLYTLSNNQLTRSTSSTISKYLKYSDGKIVPNNAYSITSKLLMRGGTSSDSRTVIATGALKQIDLDL